MIRVVLVLLLLIPVSTHAQEPTETPVMTQTLTLYPTPLPLADGSVIDAMHVVAGETVRLSATTLGMFLLSPLLLLGGMHLLWGFIVRRTRS